jgi:1-acyl-sn-glycerol-3-phosphate acyltransferase
MAVGAAVYSPTRYALLPAVARDTGWSLGRVNSLIEMGGAAAIVGGALLGYQLYEQVWAKLPDWPAPVVVAAVLNLAAALLAIPAYFPSDVRRPEPPLAAVSGFFGDGRRILADREARYALFGLAFFLALMTVGTGAMAGFALEPSAGVEKDRLLRTLLLVFLAVAAGSWLAGFQKHLYRGLGLVPVAAVGMFLALAWILWTGSLQGPCLLLGLMGGMLNVPLRAFYQSRVPPDARGNGMAFMNLSIYLATLSLSVLLIGLAKYELVSGKTAQLGLLMVLAGVGIVAAAVLAFRPLLELVLEILLWPIYRIRAEGPGVVEFPMRGPVLIVANHTAWMDPIWLGKVVPRFLTPMMTSVYYDKPGIRWLMDHVTHTIRVPQSTFRREAPELRDAVAALDAGRVLLVFPEGALKRKEEQHLRHFGQGIWRILKERPQTPIVACWIEGGWSSYTSYFNGPPTANKRLDWWRRIRIGMAAPRVLGAKVLSDQRGTRSYLMQTCLDARDYLGLPRVELPQQADDALDVDQTAGT